MLYTSMLNFGVLHGWLVDLLYWQVGMSHEQAGKVHVQAGGIHVLNGRLSWQVGRAHGLDEGVAGLAVRGVHLKVRWIHRLDSYSACTSAGSAVSLLPQTVILLGGQGSVSSLFVSPHLMIIAGKSNIGRKLVTCCFFFTDIG